MKGFIEEQNRCEYLMFLIKNENDELLGRINLSLSNGKAEIGYRIGYKHQGKGYASQAVKEVLKIAKEEYGLHEVLAGTSSTNLASRKVLEKNGFVLVNQKPQSMMINGVWIDELNFKLDL